jgi:hypothetical protein
LKLEEAIKGRIGVSLAGCGLLVDQSDQPAHEGDEAEVPAAA